MALSPVCDYGAIRSALRERARELGALDVRIAGAQPLDRAAQAMREAFARGDFTTWRYDDAYARAAADPSTILEGARSVICVALPYGGRAPDERGRGRVSAYVGTTDYHRRMRDVLQRLAELIDEFAGTCVTAIACDTKPLAERAFAAMSGLAWIGKHTNAITPAGGSYVFLGEIVTTLDLPPDEPLRKNCGACTRCVNVCPTAALRGDYTIDATRCISDLTQRTDAIPRELRPLVGTWVWGCDLCQEVCPPNAAANAVTRDDTGALAPDLIEMLQMRSGTFKRRYAQTAMGWRGAAVLRRNAAVALGNALDRAGVPALAAALENDRHPMVRGHAAWALGRIGSPQAVDALEKRLPRERDMRARAEIAAALEPFERLQAFSQA